MLAFVATMMCSVQAYTSARVQTARVGRSAVRMDVPWELRVAGAVDVDELSRLSKLPSSIVSQLVATGASCVAADLDGKLMAFTLVNTFKRVKNPAAGAAGGLETTGEVMKAYATPKGKQMLSKTTLGSLKLLKGLGASEVRTTVSSTDGEMVTYFTGLGFGDGGRTGDFLSLKGTLFAMNSDPGKRVEPAPVVRKARAAPVAEAPAEAPAEESAEESADAPVAA